MAALSSSRARVLVVLVAAAAGVLFTPQAARASHYLIADVPDVIPKEYHAALATAGIVNTQQLYDRTAARKSRKALARQTRIKKELLIDWARFLDLMQISGVGPKMTRLLIAAGTKTLRQLQKADATALAAQMRAVNRGARYSEVTPPEGVVLGWIAAAKRIAPRLEG